MAQRYSESLKSTMVKKLTSPGGPSSVELSKEVGICHQTLSRWVREYGSINGMGKNKKRQRDMDSEGRFKIVLETAGMSEEELGEYLRKKGLHSSDIERWKEEFIEGAKSRGKGRPKKDPEIFKQRKKIQSLERELRRKEKALAEASALLVLKKKAELIWGASEDEESD